jgi:uncharacterized repeat protein (TIGR01451 family)
MAQAAAQALLATVHPVSGQPGYYTFTNLISGTYQARFELPNGYTVTLPSGAINDPANSDAYPETYSSALTGPIVVLPNTHSPDVDAGITPIRMAIGNRLWIDINNDGLDTNEAAVVSATVELRDTSGAVISTTVTDSDGYYYFANLAEGDYVIAVPAANFAAGGALAGYRSSTPTDENVNNDENGDDNGIEQGDEIVSAVASLRYNSEPTNDGASIEDLRADGNINGNYSIDFGFWLPASLGNYVWGDANSNGLQDEPSSSGINGVTVRLLDYLGNVISTTVTANDPAGSPGYYTFTNLLSGTYQVEFDLSTLPPGTRVTSPNLGADDALDSDGDPVTGRSAPITLFPGDVDPTIDLGVITPAGLGDYVWIDADKDGQQDAGEVPVPGVNVTLYLNGVPISTTVTAASGLYQFLGLNPGVPYTVSFTLPDGFSWTTPGSDPASNLDSNVDVGGNTQPVVLAPGEYNSSIDAGLWQPSSVAIVKSTLNPGAVRAGQTLNYQIVVRNTGLTQAKQVVVDDPLPANTTYLSASPEAVVANGIATWPAVTLDPGAAFTVTLQLRVNDTISSTPVITNIAAVTTLDQSRRIASQPAVNPLNPTALTLDAFSAERQRSGVLVLWRTSLERDTLGFNVWRSASTQREDAVKVNAALIPAQTSSGGSYRFVDVDASGIFGSYWIEEIELSGASIFYGPALLASPVLLPKASAGGSELVVSSLGGVAVRANIAPAFVPLAPENTQRVAAGDTLPLAPTQPTQPVAAGGVDSPLPAASVQDGAVFEKPAQDADVQARVPQGAAPADTASVAAPTAQPEHASVSVSINSSTDAQAATRTQPLPLATLAAAAGLLLLLVTALGTGILVFWQRRPRA